MQGAAINVTWEQAIDQFQYLIKFAAGQRYRNGTDRMLSAEDLYQEGMIKLYTCWTKWCKDPARNKTMEEFGPIFRKALFRKMNQTHRRTPTCVDVEDASNTIEDPNAEDVVQNMYLEAGINHIIDMLTNETAKSIVRELYKPSERTLYEVWADIRRKEMLKSQGKRVNVPKDHTVRMKHIMRALGITTKQYDTAMLEIREVGPMVLADL